MGHRLVHPRGRQRGFSLVELMIAMTIGLFVIATVGYVYLGAKTSFNNMQALANLQETARFAFEYMGKDIRMAGYNGGPADGGTPVNVVNTPTSWDPNLKDLYNTPLKGYPLGGSFPPGISPLAGTDALTVVHADNDDEYSLASAPSGSSFTISCPASGTPLPEAGEILVVSDYTHSAVFQTTSVSPSSGCSTTLTANHATSGATPGNSSTALGTFGGGFNATKLYPLRAATYYVANNAAGMPTLYRLELGHDEASASATATAMEVVEGVQDMQILYGEDTVTEAPTDLKDVTVYHAANSVADWSKVYSVRITLTLVSNPDTKVTTTGGLLTKSFTNTIAVRNRLL